MLKENDIVEGEKEEKRSEVKQKSKHRKEKY